MAVNSFMGSPGGLQAAGASVAIPFYMRASTGLPQNAGRGGGGSSSACRATRAAGGTCPGSFDAAGGRTVTAQKERGGPGGPPRHSLVAYAYLVMLSTSL